MVFLLVRNMGGHISSARWFCIGLALLIIMVLSISCSNQQQNGTMHESTSKESIVEEIKELYALDASFFQHNTDIYELTASVDIVKEQDATRLKYTIGVKYTDNEMLDVVATAVLPKQMMKFLDAPHLYISNYDTTHCDLGKGKYPGFYLSRYFVLKKAEDIDTKMFITVFREMRVKVSWTDRKGNRHDDYFLLDENLIDVADSVYDYFK